MIIAVDGSAASGKGTLAKRLALHFDLAHLDTGSLYRALGLHLLRSGVTAENAEENKAAAAVASLDPGLADSPEIRTDAVAGMASVAKSRCNVVKALRTAGIAAMTDAMPTTASVRISGESASPRSRLETAAAALFSSAFSAVTPDLSKCSPRARYSDPVSR